MSRPIKLTNNEINQCLQDFCEMLQRNDLADDTIRFTKSIETNQKVEVILSPIAYVKIKLLVQDFSKEVQWHGIVERINESTFKIKDIMVFPHEISATTVTSDQEKYEEWLDTLSDEEFNCLRFHGHSHVNMSCSPSGIDMGYRKNLVSTILPNQSNAFYIFMIFNKKNEFTGEVYDIANNILYKSSDIKLSVELDEKFGTSIAFLDNAHSLATEPKPVPPVKKEADNKGSCKWYDRNKEHEEAVRSQLGLSNAGGITPSEDKLSLDEMFID